MTTVRLLRWRATLRATVNVASSLRFSFPFHKYNNRTYYSSMIAWFMLVLYSFWRQYVEGIDSRASLAYDTWGFRLSLQGLTALPYDVKINIWAKPPHLTTSPYAKMCHFPKQANKISCNGLNSLSSHSKMGNLNFSECKVNGGCQLVFFLYGELMRLCFLWISWQQQAQTPLSLRCPVTNHGVHPHWNWHCVSMLPWHCLQGDRSIFLSGIICYIIALLVHSMSKYGILWHSLNITVITWLIFGSSWKDHFYVIWRRLSFVWETAC